MVAIFVSNGTLIFFPSFIDFTFTFSIIKKRSGYVKPVKYENNVGLHWYCFYPIIDIKKKSEVMWPNAHKFHFRYKQLTKQRVNFLTELYTIIINYCHIRTQNYQIASTCANNTLQYPPTRYNCKSTVLLMTSSKNMCHAGSVKYTNTFETRTNFVLQCAIKYQISIQIFVCMLSSIYPEITLVRTISSASGLIQS